MKILAGIVVYNAPSSTYHLLRELQNQGCYISIIVNACESPNDLLIYRQQSTYFANNNLNKGLAYALNQIISQFRSSRYDYLFLFDQDSMITKGYISQMVLEYDNIRKQGNSIVCLAPLIRDIKYELPSSGRVRKMTADIANTKNLTAATSGCLFTQCSFDVVGMMDEKLFIDGIDHDWCLRAWASNSSIFFSKSAVLLHCLADKFLCIGNYSKPIHDNPLRHYYITRNSIYLIRKEGLPASWKLKEAAKTIRRVFAYPLLSSSHLLSLKMILRAIYHGIILKMGKLSSSEH